MFRISHHLHTLCSTSLLFHPSFLFLIFWGFLIELLVMAYYSYDYCQAQALNDDHDEDHFVQQMVDAFVEMV